MGAWAALHAAIAASVTLTAWHLRRPPAILQSIIEKETARTAGYDSTQPARRGWSKRLREFGRWQFWLPLLIVATILLGSGRPWEAVAWLVLRFVAVGCVLIALVSLFRPVYLAEQLRQRGWWGPALALSGAISRRDSTK